MTNIFVGNVSYQTTQDDLHAAFAAYGSVERVAGAPIDLIAFGEITNLTPITAE